LADCERELYGLLKGIEPTATQRAGAERSHNYLRDILCTGNMGARIETSYLSGSYARYTAVYPLDDVDIIFLIDPSHWENPTPEAVLRTFERAIRRRYDGSSLRIQRRSVRLRLNHLDIDVVPAIESKDDFIKIPDRREAEWIKSGPKRHSDLATKVNQARNGKFKPLVKLLKYWNNNLPSTAHQKSFLVETMATRLFERAQFETLDQGLFLFFDFIAHCKGEPCDANWRDKYGMSFSWFSGKLTVPDTAGTGSNVAAKVDSDTAERFVQHAVRSRNKLREGLESRRTDTAIRRAYEALRVP
jgi:hypothetical protein